MKRICCRMSKSKDIIMDKNERIIAVDTARAYLIMLVIIGHVLIVINRSYSILLLNCIQEFIYSFHMAAFFIIHGTLISADRWSNTYYRVFLRKKIMTIAVPYLFFECIGTIWKSFFWGQSLITGLWNMLTIQCNVGADWFLPALLLGDFLVFLYTKINKRGFGVITIVFAIVILMVIPKSPFFTVIGRGIMAYLFIMIGLLGKSIVLSEKTGEWYIIIGSFLVTVCCAIINLEFTGNDFYSITLGNPCTFLIAGICGTCMIFGMARRFSSKMTETVGQHTLTIMGTHQLIIYAFIASVGREIYDGSIYYGFALLVMVIVIEIPLVYLVDKYLYFLVGKTQK